MTKLFLPDCLTDWLIAWLASWLTGCRPARVICREITCVSVTGALARKQRCHGRSAINSLQTSPDLTNCRQTWRNVTRWLCDTKPCCYCTCCMPGLSSRTLRVCMRCVEPNANSPAAHLARLSGGAGNALPPHIAPELHWLLPVWNLSLCFSALANFIHFSRHLPVCTFSPRLHAMFLFWPLPPTLNHPTACKQDSSWTGNEHCISFLYEKVILLCALNCPLVCLSVSAVSVDISVFVGKCFLGR